MMQPGFIFSLMVLAITTAGARGAGPERMPLAGRAAVKARSPDLLASFEAARETNLTAEALVRFAPAWEQAGRELVAKLPKLAMVRRRSHGLRGTNGTMFAQRTDRGSSILVWDPARPAGGMELAGKDHNPPVRIFPDRSDPVYQALWQALEKGKAALLARPRMDMPGAVAIPQERNFGKVY